MTPTEADHKGTTLVTSLGTVAAVAGARDGGAMPASATDAAAAIEVAATASQGDDGAMVGGRDELELDVHGDEEDDGGDDDDGDDGDNEEEAALHAHALALSLGEANAAAAAASAEEDAAGGGDAAAGDGATASVSAATAATNAARRCGGVGSVGEVNGSIDEDDELEDEVEHKKGSGLLTTEK